MVRKRSVAYQAIILRGIHDCALYHHAHVYTDRSLHALVKPEQKLAMQAMVDM